MAARKSRRSRPEAVQVDLDLDFTGPPPSLTSGAPPIAGAESSREPRESPSGQRRHSEPAAPPGVDRPVDDESAGPDRATPGTPPILTVTQLTKRIRRLLESDFGHVWVTGELSNVRRQPNGHSYFTLKDAGAQLSCVLFRGHAAPGMPVPEDGLQVQLGGEISVYEPRGQYQLIVHEVQVAGVGVLQAKFEALKRKLSAEGLFEASRKRPLPSFPSCLALVTSPSGAAVRDMLNILGRRAAWVRVLIFPVRVQGEGAAEEITAAVRALGNAGALGLPQPDVIVVARGGGSIEDLWCFNEEIVARALAGSPVPTVSAVGHEIDFTIADFAADLRALTPSAAAELIVPDAADLRRRLHAQQRALTAHAQDALRHARTIVEFHRRGPLVREPRRLLAQGAQQVDALASDLTDAASSALRLHRDRLTALGHRLATQRPAHVLAQRQQSLAHLQSRLLAAATRHLTARNERFARARDLLRSLGPQAVLSRGYTMTLTPAGQTLTRATQVRPGDRLTTRLADGSVESIVSTPRLPPGAKSGRSQGP
ncbi:MAG: exodeoxyribonuclease VII large subunit [Verrucomicrobiales bacterium]